MHTLHGLGFSGALLLLAGCAAPNEARTPTSGPMDSGPISTLQATSVRGGPGFYAARSTSLSALPPELQATWDKSGLPVSGLSLVIAEIGQPPLASINPLAPRNPASVMKLITTYAALEGLGPSYTWRTELLADAGVGPRADGSLSGPLYVRADGDPQFELSELWQLLRELRMRGIQSLPGIVVDRTIFGPVAIDPGDFDDAPDRVYNASPDAFIVGYGAVRVLAQADGVGRRWIVHADPPLPGLHVDNQLKATAAACPGRPAVRTALANDATGASLRVTGTVALSCGDFSLYRLVGNQRDYAAGVLQTMWQDLGGTLTGPIRDGVTPPDAVVLARHDSEPLAEQIRTVNKVSNNLMARMMLLTLGKELGQGPATVATGTRAVNNVLRDNGLAFPELVIQNGSGLSRGGRVSAASLAALLDHAWQSPRMPEFLSSMAIAGEDGTVRRRMKGSSSQGRAHLKTGTLRASVALAGYVQGVSGRRYLMVSLVNDDAAYKAHAFNNQVVEWLSSR